MTDDTGKAPKPGPGPAGRARPSLTPEGEAAKAAREARSAALLRDNLRRRKAQARARAAGSDPPAGG